MLVRDSFNGGRLLDQDPGPYGTSADGTEKSAHSVGLQGVDILLFVNHGLP